MSVWERWMGEAAGWTERVDAGAELATARAAAVRWRPVTSLATFFLPLPLVAQPVPSVGGRWLDDPADRPRTAPPPGLNAPRAHDP